MIENVQHAVLAGIIRSSGTEALDRFLYASTQLTDDHFDPYEKACWMLLGRLVEATGKLPDYGIIDHQLANTNLSIDVQAEVRSLWLVIDGLENPNEADFRYAVYMTHELRKKSLFAESLATAGEILTFGKTVGRNSMQGYDDSRRYFEDQLMKIDGMEKDHMPEGNMRVERDELLDCYSGTTIVKHPTGIGVLDRLTSGGFGPGQLILFAGYTGEGKSFLNINISHYFLMQGLNVVYFSTETLKSEVNIRMGVRHSHLPQFNCPGGLSYSEVLSNTLSPEHYQVWQEVVLDFTSDESPYGRFDVVQVPEDTPMSFIRSKLRAYQSIFNVDIVVIDELQMLSAARRRDSEREELAQVIRAAKQLAVDFDGGRGVPILSPWQISRSAWEEAKKNGGRYTRSSLSETAEAERRADMVISMYKHPESRSRVSAQLLKQRSGPSGDFELYVDYAHCYVGAGHAPLEAELPPLNI